MQSLAFDDLLKIHGITEYAVVQWRNRDQIPLAFGRNAMYRALGYLPIDLVALRLCDLLAEQLGRDLAAAIVRDQWGVWMRAAARAEATPDAPTFFYACSFTNERGKRRHLTLGSALDPDAPGALHAIATDIRQKTGVALQKYVAADMTEVLRQVRKRAAAAGYDLSSPFLPVHDPERLEEILKPYDDAVPDRAIVTGPTAKQAARAGATARQRAEALMASGAVH